MFVIELAIVGFQLAGINNKILKVIVAVKLGRPALLHESHFNIPTVISQMMRGLLPDIASSAFGLILFGYRACFSIKHMIGLLPSSYLSALLALITAGCDLTSGLMYIIDDVSLAVVPVFWLIPVSGYLLLLVDEETLDRSDSEAPKQPGQPSQIVVPPLSNGPIYPPQVFPGTVNIQQLLHHNQPRHLHYQDQVYVWPANGGSEPIVFNNPFSSASTTVSSPPPFIAVPHQHQLNDMK